MASPLLETKLHVPRVPRGLVVRPRLSERLTRGGQSKLTLISAPAGFGKSTLLAEWLAAMPADQWSAAWLALDPGDNHAVVFWTYVIAALQAVAPKVGAKATSLLEEAQPRPIETVLATLLNDLNSAPKDIVLVLDDFHVIDAPDVQTGMAFLLEHLPAQIHLVIATRADPALPLGRLRARGELVEVRAADLRFTPDEAAAYLNEVMGLDLAAVDIAALERRTEGWIAALQLAGLSMQGRDDVGSFIAGFAGDDRYIVDYLVEEVLRRQPEDFRSFLLQTCILDRLTGPLCDAVTGREGGRARLEALDRANLFVIQLDDRRQWYRYHRLFAGVLQAHLVDEQPDRVLELHRRASKWHEHNGDQLEAIHYALAGADFERAANLVELAIPAMRQGRQEATVRRWLEALPNEVIALRPVLSVHHAGALLVGGQLEGAEARLRDAERWLDATTENPRRQTGPAAGPIVVDEQEFRRLPAAIAIYRAAQALAVGDMTGTIAHAQRALDVVAEGDHLARGAAAGFLGLTYWTRGELEAAHSSWEDAVASLHEAGHVADVLGCTIALADIRIAQGRLRDAMTTYDQALRLSRDHGEPVLRGTADMHVGLGDLLREQGDLQRAAQHMEASSELGEHAGLAQNPYRWHVAMARMREAAGDPEGALNLLEEAVRVYVSDYFPNVRPIPAQEARVWLRHGRSGEALGWARERDLSPQDELSYLREFEHITFARLLLAQSVRDGEDGSLQEAMKLLGRLLEAAQAGGRSGSVIEILVQLALAHQAHGDGRAALGPLERALTLAEPEGYVRVFADEGPPLATLLEAAARHGIAPDYVGQLLASVGQPEDGKRVRQRLVEPLSERELDVLRLLATELNGPDIARELFISLNTVRTHTKNIFAKLGVNNRRAAVRRAGERDLLSRRRDP
jgi:LuxR family transcriptional regulator, maltose regulon positive regulatory protein